MPTLLPTVLNSISITNKTHQVDKVQVQRLSGNLNGEIRISGSKSISNRMLIIDTLADEKLVLKNLSTSDDTLSLKKSLTMIRTCASSRIPLVVDAGNAGTVLRFLTALLSVTEGQWLLTGSERMKIRPVGELVSALKKLGADIEYANELGYPPLLIKGTGLKSKELVLDASQSSQFVSALMMIAPELSDGLKINFKNRPVSFPYIEMTAKLMQECGIEVLLTDESVEVKPGTYKAVDYHIEPDWSSASYWYEMAALSDSASVLLPGFVKESLQGDQIIAEVFNNFGVQTTYGDYGIWITRSRESTDYFKYNFEACPDLVPAVLATCAAKGITAELEGVSHLKYKESDRLEVLKDELAKVGAKIILRGNFVDLVPSSVLPQSEIIFDTYKDHRIAMCLAPLALKFAGVSVNEPNVVHKSYASFWKDIQQLGILSVDKN